MNDLEQIKEIFSRSRKFMISTGNLSQWKDPVELESLVVQDIRNNNFYVCEDDFQIVGVFCFFIGNEPTYNKIYDGNWLNTKPYGVIHRIASLHFRKGIASFCINWCLKQCPNIKIDTHQDNMPMQQVILKNGFRYCGNIKKEDGSYRLAYQSRGD